MNNILSIYIMEVRAVIMEVRAVVLEVRVVVLEVREAVLAAHTVIQEIPLFFDGSQK